MELSHPESPGGRRVVVALAALAAVGLLAGYGVAMRARPKRERISLASPGPQAGRSKAVFVHVAGAVERPGLYELDGGARVNDAVDAAGGATRKADLDGLNLAATVKDGDKVLVPSRAQPGGPAPPGGAPPGSAVAGPASAAVSGGLVNLNAATIADLETLPGVGPALAQRIIDYRTEHGGFRRVEDLMDVAGIGPKKYEDIKDRVTV